MTLVVPMDLAEAIIAAGMTVEQAEACVEPWAEARLAQRDVPEDTRSLVASVLAERAARRSIHKIDQPAVVGLFELVNRLANEQMEIQFAAQGAQLPAFSAI